MLESDFKELEEFTIRFYLLSQNNRYGMSFFFEGSGINPFEYAKNAINSCQENIKEKRDIIQRALIIKDLKKHMSLITDFLRNMNHQSANNILLKIMISYLQETQQLFHESFTHEEEIENAINELSTNKGKGNSKLAELILLCLKYQYYNSAIKCIERIFLIVKNIMKND